MTLRPFTIDDAPIILSWIKDKTAFHKWSADRDPTFPPKPEDMVSQYVSDVIFPFTAIDDEGKVVGHIMLRYPEPSKTVIRFGFVIVDDQLRGKGYCKKMLQLAIQKAMNEYGAKKITLGVFDNNPSAFHCYESVGFKVIGTGSSIIDGEEWMEKEMKYYIEEIEYSKVAYMRRIGQYGEENYKLMCKMKAWADERGLLTNDAVLFGIALDNPQFTKPNECRYDVCLLAPGAKDIATEDQVEIRNLCGGKYAVFTIDHTADAVANFWQSFSTEMYSCGLTMDVSRPIMERYSVKMVTNGLCEMCVPVLTTSVV